MYAAKFVPWRAFMSCDICRSLALCCRSKALVSLFTTNAALPCARSRHRCGRRAGKTPGTLVQRFGAFGGSQGGWVAPLTATLVPLDFVIVGYGWQRASRLRDRDEVEEEVRAAGFGDDVTSEA